MFHPNDESFLRPMLRLKDKEPFPPTALGIYLRARHLAMGSGTLPPATLIDICMRIQDAEAAQGRPMPAMPEGSQINIPQHQRMPNSMLQKKESPAVIASPVAVPQQAAVVFEPEAEAQEEVEAEAEESPGVEAPKRRGRPPKVPATV